MRGDVKDQHTTNRYAAMRVEVKIQTFVLWKNDSDCSY